MKFGDFIEFLRTVKMLQKDRFYALVVVVALNSGAYWLVKILEVLK